jgi:hypothetical protein
MTTYLNHTIVVTPGPATYPTNTFVATWTGPKSTGRTSGQTERQALSRAQSTIRRAIGDTPWMSSNSYRRDNP